MAKRTRQSTLFTQVFKILKEGGHFRIAKVGDTQAMRCDLVDVNDALVTMNVNWHWAFNHFMAEGKLVKSSSNSWRLAPSRS